MVMVWLMTEGVTEILKGYWNGSIQDEHRIYVLSMFVADQRESPMKFQFAFSGLASTCGLANPHVGDAEKRA